MAPILDSLVKIPLFQNMPFRAHLYNPKLSRYLLKQTNKNQPCLFHLLENSFKIFFLTSNYFFSVKLGRVKNIISIQRVFSCRMFLDVQATLDIS